VPICSPSLCIRLSLAQRTPSDWRISASLFPCVWFFYYSRYMYPAPRAESGGNSWGEAGSKSASAPAPKDLFKHSSMAVNRLGWDCVKFSPFPLHSTNLNSFVSGLKTIKSGARPPVSSRIDEFDRKHSATFRIPRSHLHTTFHQSVSTPTVTITMLAHEPRI
jgi:hypothetical protein